MGGAKDKRLRTSGKLLTSDEKVTLNLQQCTGYNTISYWVIITSTKQYDSILVIRTYHIGYDHF